MEVEAPLLLELGLLLLVLTAMSGLAWKIGFSAAPLFLIVGLLSGTGGVVPFDHSVEFLEVAAGVGVLLLLLTLGLEFSVGEFQESLKKHTPTGLLDLFLNATPGIVAGFLLGFEWPAALALGGVTWISSSGIIAKLLDDLGRLGFRETPAILSVLVIEDVAMAAYLPLLGVVLVGGSLLVGVGSAVVAVAVTILVIVGLKRVTGLANRFFSHEDDEQVLFRILGTMLVVAGLASFAGISSAVGAFLVGLAIPEEAVARVRQVLQPLRNLFAAFFFFVFGLLIDPADLPPVLGAACALAFITVFTKVGTGWFAAGREGAGLRGRVRAGTALIARGEFSIIIAGLAVGAGYVALGPLASAYVLIVAVLGPVLARSADWWTGLAFGAPESRRRVAVERRLAPTRTYVDST